MNGRRVVATIQARMGSTRLPGKVLAPIAGRPLVLWTVAAMRAVPAVDALVVATTSDRSDDPLAQLLEASGVTVHRGPVDDVLRRIVDAVRLFEPDLVVRETADNPFVDPTIVDAQVRRAIEGDLDYLGIDGWPLGIAAEVARFDALEVADREATTLAEREHVMPFIYARPERFRIGSLEPASLRIGASNGVERYTVDTPEDLAFARAIADRLGPLETTTLAEVRAIVAAEPTLAAINRDVPQRHWQEAQPR